MFLLNMIIDEDYLNSRPPETFVDPLNVLLIFLIISLFITVIVILSTPKTYMVIDNKYVIKKNFFQYYVYEVDDKRTKRNFYNYRDCIAYIEERKKGYK